MKISREERHASKNHNLYQKKVRGHPPPRSFMQKFHYFLQTCYPDPEGEWTAHKVELALWTEVIARKYNFDLSPHVNSCENGVHSAKRKAEEVPKAKKRAKK